MPGKTGRVNKLSLGLSQPHRKNLLMAESVFAQPPWFSGFHPQPVLILLCPPLHRTLRMLGCFDSLLHFFRSEIDNDGNREHFQRTYHEAGTTQNSLPSLFCLTCLSLQGATLLSAQFCQRENRFGGAVKLAQGHIACTW